MKLGTVEWIGITKQLATDYGTGLVLNQLVPRSDLGEGGLQAAISLWITVEQNDP